jgi:two-component system sensor histidine kinase YesM
MWNIVAGKTEFKNGKQYEIIDQANAQIESMIANTNSDKSRMKLEVVHRTMDTLTRYVDKMGKQIEQGSRVVDNELVFGQHPRCLGCCRSEYSGLHAI